MAQSSVGKNDGAMVGTKDGAFVGLLDGLDVGRELVGLELGSGVGTEVGNPFPST